MGRYHPRMTQALKIFDANENHSKLLKYAQVELNEFLFVLKVAKTVNRTLKFSLTVKDNLQISAFFH
jgi:hypothetical protein